MRWGKKTINSKKADDKSVLIVNPRIRLTQIPDQAHQYTISGRTPLEWAIGSLKVKVDKDSGIVNDPNGWVAWQQEPFELICHLKRLIYLSVRSTEIIDSLPPSLEED